MYPQVFGKYVLEKELATGGMARVLLATLRGAGGFEKKLVVKQIRDELAVDHEFVQRFVEEAKTTVALSHPNIVPVYELGIEMGTYYLAMELVDGVSVDQLLTRGPDGSKSGLSPEEGAYIGVEMCRALDYAHRRMQVIHRDITPRNVMVDEEGQVKIIDFGIAARASVAGQDVFGTPGHMPPEQLRREEIGPATDIFAVAVLLMELWSGNPPFRRKTPVESLAQMHLPHPKPSAVDPRLAPLDAIVSKAMALAKADRPQQADELARALRKFLADVDLGDIERKLGARVKEARAAAAAAAAKKKRGPDGLVKPSKPSMPDMGPRTFAVRAEVDGWKPEHLDAGSGPGAGGELGTRRLPPSEHPPPDSEVPKVETVATRPIETPITPPGDAASKPRRGRFWALVAAAVVVPALTWGALRASEGPGAPTTTSTSVGTAASAPTSNATPTPTSAPTSNATPTSTPNATSTSTSTSTSASTPTAVGSAAKSSWPTGGAGSGTATALDAHVTLIGDPGTLVQLDEAASPRPSPFGAAIAAGSHHVHFTFPDTKEVLNQDFTAKPGEHITVRAEFTGAFPQVHVQR